MDNNNLLAQTQVVVLGGACSVMLAAMCLATRWFNVVPARAFATNDLGESDEMVVEATILRGWRRSFHHLDLYGRHIYSTCFAIIFAVVASLSTTPWVPYVSLGVYPIVAFHAWKVLAHAFRRDAAHNEIEHWEKVRDAIRVR